MRSILTSLICACVLASCFTEPAKSISVCCCNDGTCLEVSSGSGKCPQNCENAQWETKCNPNPCYDSGNTGACCGPNGCYVTTQQQCKGEFKVGTNCVPNPCSGGGGDTGACCQGPDCTLKTELECGQVDGEFKGVGTNCVSNPCVKKGACWTCTETTEKECAGSFAAGGKCKSNQKF